MKINHISMTSAASSTLPSVGDITMCTILRFSEDNGFTVLLNEYAVEGTLPLSELSRKKVRKPHAFFKIGELTPLSVSLAGPDYFELSKKHLKDEEIARCTEDYQNTQQLYALAKRLSHIEFTEEDWRAQFARELTDKSQSPHPFLLLSDKTRIRESTLDSQYLDVLEKSHAKLFGITPHTESLKFTVQSFAVEGNEDVKRKLEDVLAQARHSESVYTNQELYDNPERYNLTLRLIGIPEFEMVVSAYREDRVTQVIQQIKTALQSVKFDYLKIDHPCSPK